MSGLQPITIEEQSHYLATRNVTRGKTHTPTKNKSKKLSGPAVARTLATFGTPDNLPGFKFPVGSTVHIGKSSINWIVVSQAETPDGTNPHSYRVSAGKADRIVGESALRSPDVAPAILVPTKKPLKVVDVRLNKKTGEIEPVGAAHAKKEVRKMLEASAALLAPKIDEPALFTVEPITPKFTVVTTLKQTGRKSTSPAPRTAGPSTPRLNAPFPTNGTVTLLKARTTVPGRKNHEWNKLVMDALKENGSASTADILAAGKAAGHPIVAELKYDRDHGYISIS